MTTHIDVAVVGAGPYGLAVAAHLGERAVVFGKPLLTWRKLMPPGMQLRAAWDDMSLTKPGEPGGLDDWLKSTGRVRREPMTVDDFLEYGEWFRGTYVRRAVEDDAALVDDGASSGLEVVTGSGEQFTAREVVVAVGATPFAQLPPPFDAFAGDAVQLATTFSAYGALDGRSVLVVGAGQTGLETAARAVESGADVEIVARSGVVWFADREPYVERSRLGRLAYDFAYPAVGYGPPLLNRLVLHPDLFSSLPAGVRRYVTRRLLKPGGSPWLRSRVEGNVRIAEGVHAVTVAADRGRVTVGLSDDTTRTVDIVLVAAGYAFDLDRLEFLSPRTRERIRTRRGWPVLDRELRTTHPRIAFVGYAAEALYGPSARFVLGVRFAAPRAAAGVERRLQRRL